MKPDTENRYLNARREYNELYGQYAAAASQWRIFGLICLVVLAGSLALNAFQAHQKKIIPYAVEFNEHSEVVRVTPASEAMQPNANHIKAALRNWIVGARSIFGDRRALEKYIEVTYAMTLSSGPAYKELYSFHEENNPYVRSQKEAVDVAVNSIFLISGNTWRVEWTETTKEVSGRVLDTRVWQGAFTVVVVPPINEAEVMVNPLGVKVEKFTWAARI